MINKLDTTVRKNIKTGMYVKIKTPEDKNLKRGIVSIILSRADNQSGIKVELTDNTIGYVQEIYTIDMIKLENFKFYNRFIYEPFVFSIWDKQTKKYLLVKYRHHTMNDSFNTVFIADNKNDLTRLIKQFNLDKKRYIINRIKNNTSLSQSFKEIEDIEMVLINNFKYLRYFVFLEIEKEIKIKSSLTY